MPDGEPPTHRERLLVLFFVLPAVFFLQQPAGRSRAAGFDPAQTPFTYSAS